ncbi:insulinase family protein [Flavobacteriaceae bacterium AU392]|nr:insulinase family protein [Flavobacteriaceae bacterium]RKM82682.1 insulinase family protein [Flavobacteriaceae bacterium AU392]
MKRITLTLFLLMCIVINAQTINLNQPLPVDQEIKKGVLPNGMTYYLKSTDVTKDVASYYIIQNVGSVLENDDQKGLAHFLEHMAFNGTKNFEGKGILNTMEKHGLVFGRDINAYTSFDETVYNVNNIPTTPELIDTGLLILHDWSNYLLLTDSEIDAERGVVNEEWRTRQSGAARVFQHNIGTTFNNSKYAERLPIGEMDIIQNFDYKVLRDFYHDWYRTDLQAIAIVGDINIDEVEQKIKKLFSGIPAVKNPKERFTVEIEDNNELVYSMAKDKEVTTSQISFGIRHPKSLENETIGDLKTSLLNGIATNLISTRLREISQKPDASFLNAFVGYGGLSRASNSFSIRISPKPDMQHQAFKDVFAEVNRAVKFGFTSEEIKRAVLQFSTFYENQIARKDDAPHQAIIRTIQLNYLENDNLTDVVKEYEIVKQIFGAITKNELHETIKNLYTKNNRTLTVTGVEGKKNLTKEDALAIISASENDASLTAYEDGFSGKTLVSGLTIKNGSIISEKEESAIGATTFTLSNGVKVHYKFVNKNKDQVQLNAISYGGLSLIDDASIPSANFVGTVADFSGLGDYSRADLPKVLAGKTATTRLALGELTESITGNSTTKDVETLLQMTHLRFVKPRFDNDSYKVLMGNIDNALVARSKNINVKIQDSVTTTLYGKNNPKQRLFDANFVKDISFEKVRSIYKDRFGNAADFEFFIVGDVQKEQLKPLLEKYIASIPTNNTKENWKDNSTDWISSNIDKDVFLKMEDPKSTVRISYKNDMDYSLKNVFIARTLGRVLQLRYTETLREDEGGTYGASAFANMTKRPTTEASLSVFFDGNPDKIENLVTIVHKEIEKIANGEINQSDLDKVLATTIKDRKQQQDYNRYDMTLLRNYFREGYNMNEAKNFENIVNSIKASDLQNFTKALLKDGEKYEIVIKPKQ